MNKKIMVEFKNAMEYLNSHPAFNGLSPLEFSCIDCMEVCKNGYALGGYDEADQLITNPDGKKVGRVLRKRNDEVPYKDYFGYKWKYDHIDIWLESGAFTYENAFDYIGNRYHDSNLDCGARTIEEAIIKLEVLVKKFYGDYTCSQLDPAWVNTHNKRQPDFFIETKGVMTSNPDCNYIAISQADYNGLWWKDRRPYKEFGVDANQFNYVDKYKNKISYFLDREIEQEKFKKKNEFLRSLE